ncbi:nicotinate-nucleotide--dimethylbenzimidazole phosphoribosyltransferase [Streptomyces cinnamoneus]|uniref:nicotinate-nucleotide--dimethylbenzimidazole phosphoribosyltransferase n=1 Tax=Streptomyces cinnamoneus TaxID=53446 RepID=UPI003415559D
MTDTGRFPDEGQPENAGALPGQPLTADAAAPADTGTPATSTYAFLDNDTADEDDLLLMPGAQGAWMEQPAPQAGTHETGGRDTGSLDYTGVRTPPPAAAPPRPLHMGPPVPDPTGGVVRSLADRGPAAPQQPVGSPAPQVGGVEYLDDAPAFVPPQGTGAATPGIAAEAAAPAAEAASPAAPQAVPGQRGPAVAPAGGVAPGAAQAFVDRLVPNLAPQPGAEATAPLAVAEPPAAQVPADEQSAPEPVATPDAAPEPDIIHMAPAQPAEPEAAPVAAAPEAVPAAPAPEPAPVAAPVPAPSAAAPAPEPVAAPAVAVPAEVTAVQEAPEAEAAPAAEAPPAQAPEPETVPVPATAEAEAPAAPAAGTAPVAVTEAEGTPVPEAAPATPADPSAAAPEAAPVPEAAEVPAPETVQPAASEAAETPAAEAAQAPVPEVAEAPVPEVAEAAAPETVQAPAPEAVEAASAEAAQAPAPEAAEAPAAEAVQAPAPEAVEAPAAEAVQAPVPEVAEATAPEAVQPPAPEAVQAPAPEAVQPPASEPAEAPAPEAVQPPAPDAVQTAAPNVAEAPAPTVEEAPAPTTVEAPPAQAPAPEVAEAPAPEAAEAPAPEAVQAPAPNAPVEAEAEAAAAAEKEGAAEAEAVAEASAEAEAKAEGEAEPEAESEPAVPEQPLGPPAEGFGEAERAAVHRVIRERRDIRKGFRTDPIPHEVLLRVLEAAHTAPSVGHSQPWDFVVIRSEETRQAMHELAVRQREAYAKSLPKARAKQFKELKIEAILDTPVNIVVTADPTRGGRHTLGRHTQPQMAPYSSALAVENLWLAARAEGLGVGWVSFFDEREMVRALGLPEHLEVVAYLCIGYVDEFPDEPELMQAGWSKRRPLSWVVHEEEYGRRALPGEDPHDLLAETLRGIRPLDAKALGEAWERQKRMTKPSGALGMLEIISAQLCGLSRKCPPPIPEPAAVAIFAGDHGVHAQGVTAWPQEVTSQMVANFLGGGAVCNAFANQVGAEVCVVDVGVAAELPSTPGLLPRKIRPGTADFTTGPAMTREEALHAVEVGIETARDLVTAGNKALLTGEMGIANTTVSAALIAVFTGADPAEITGRGTGINDEMHARKIDVVRRALELHKPDPKDPIGVLAAVGGLEHAALVGLILGGASLRTPVILDGVSAGAAALVARAIAPEALAACIAGHRSAEPGHVAALTKLGLRPLVDLDLRLGEGTGALLALPVVQSAARAMHEVATFDAAGVAEKG